MSKTMAAEAKAYFEREARLAEAREDARFARVDAKALLARVAEAFPGEATQAGSADRKADAA